MLSVIGLSFDLVGALTLSVGLFGHVRPLLVGWKHSPLDVAHDIAAGLTGGLLLTSGFIIQALPYLGIRPRESHQVIGLVAISTGFVAAVASYLIYGSIYLAVLGHERRRVQRLEGGDFRVRRRRRGFRFWAQESEEPNEGAAVPPPSTKRPDPDSLALIYDVVGGELAKQFDQIESLNARAQQLLGFAAITLGLVVTLRPPTTEWQITALFSFALIIFACLAAAGLYAWGIQGWRHDPEPGPLWERHRGRSAEWLRHQIILNRIASVNQNGIAIEDKLFWIRWTQRLLAVEVLYLVALTIARPYVT